MSNIKKLRALTGTSFKIQPPPQQVPSPRRTKQVRVSGETYDKLKKVAAHTGMPITHIIGSAVEAIQIPRS
jgi:hypothetical protein